MSYPVRTAAGHAVGQGQYLAPDHGRPHPRSRPLTRKYEVACLSQDGDIQEFTRLAPALPAFEQAFSAFTRGTQISTAHGPVAVEDLQPGQLLETSLGLQPLRWRGSMMLIPLDDAGAEPPLARMRADSFGPERPFHDLLMGPSMRLQGSGQTPYLGPDDLIARDCAIPIYPVAPVPLYHLVVDAHAWIEAGGLEVTSYHVSLGAERLVHGDIQAAFLSLFPHARGFNSFGPSLDRPDQVA